MLALLKRYRELIVVAVLLIYPFARMLGNAPGPRTHSFVDRAIIAATAPLQRAITWVVDGVGDVVSGYIALRGVATENERLTSENAQLKMRANQAEELSLENERLRKLLDYTQAKDGFEVTARVLGVSPVNRPLTVRINRGLDEGVKPGMPVATPDGVVGQVLAATGGYAEVLLITDRDSRVGVRVQRSRARATAAGQGGAPHLSLMNALKVDDVQDGDVVVTAGTDGVYPPGLVVGKIVTLGRESKGMFLTGEVVPAVDTTKLEEVLVLAPGSLPESLDGGMP